MALRMSSKSSKKAESSVEEKEIDGDNEVQGASPLDDNIPNGGLVAWLQVAATFMVFLNSW